MDTINLEELTKDELLALAKSKSFYISQRDIYHAKIDALQDRMDRLQKEALAEHQRLEENPTQSAAWWIDWNAATTKFDESLEIYDEIRALYRELGQ